MKDDQRLGHSLLHAYLVKSAALPHLLVLFETFCFTRLWTHMLDMFLRANLGRLAPSILSRFITKRYWVKFYAKFVSIFYQIALLTIGTVVFLDWS